MRLSEFLKQFWILLVFIVAKFFLQYLAVNPIYELHRDEFLHLDQAKHLAFGFISVPPLTSLFSYIIYLLGGDIFWVRFFPALFGVITLIICWFIVENLGGKTLAKIVALGAVLFSPFVRMNILFQPNAFEIMVWSWIFLLLLQYTMTLKRKFIFLLAIAVSLAFYNKYNIIFLLFSLFIGIILSPQRKLFFNKKVLAPMFLFLILVLPNICWQIFNDLPFFNHMAVLKSSQLDNTSGWDFLINQLMFVSGSIIVCLSGLWALFFFQGFDKFRFIGISVIILLIVYTLLKAKGYYAFGLYTGLFAFGAVYIEHKLSKNVRFIILPLLFLINLTIFILVFKIVHPVFSPNKIKENSEMFEKFGMLRWEDGENHDLPQDFADMQGWKEMANLVLLAYESISDEEKKHTIIHCDNYGQAGAVNYYKRGKLPEAFAFNTDYIYWIPTLDTIKNIVVVGEKPEDDVISLFDEFILIGEVQNENAREKGTQVYLLKGAKEILRELYYKERDSRIANFDIF